jgi:hypothetical protein
MNRSSLQPFERQAFRRWLQARQRRGSNRRSHHGNRRTGDCCKRPRRLRPRHLRWPRPRQRRRLRRLPRPFHRLRFRPSHVAAKEGSHRGADCGSNRRTDDSCNCRTNGTAVPTAAPTPASTAALPTAIATPGPTSSPVAAASRAPTAVPSLRSGSASTPPPRNRSRSTTAGAAKAGGNSGTPKRFADRRFGEVSPRAAAADPRFCRSARGRRHSGACRRRRELIQRPAQTPEYRRRRRLPTQTSGGRRRPGRSSMPPSWPTSSAGRRPPTSCGAPSDYLRAAHRGPAGTRWLRLRLRHIRDRPDHDVQRLENHRAPVCRGALGRPGRRQRGDRQGVVTGANSPVVRHDNGGNAEVQTVQFPLQRELVHHDFARSLKVPLPRHPAEGSTPAPFASSPLAPAASLAPPQK